MATITEWLEQTRKVAMVAGGMVLLRPRPRIRCADGFSMSVQAGSTSYSLPRDNIGPWVAVEVGFPSATEPLLIAYAENAEQPTGTVYAYVPVAVIDAVIQKHGGEAM